MRAISMTIPALLLFAAPAFAEDEETCPDAVSTADIVECLTEAYEDWDARLNAAYRAAIEPLEGERRTQFRDVQRAWLAYRDASCGYYRSGEGTIAAIEGNSCMVELTRTRAEELEGLGER